MILWPAFVRYLAALRIRGCDIDGLRIDRDLLGRCRLAAVIRAEGGGWVAGCAHRGGGSVAGSADARAGRKTDRAMSWLFLNEAHNSRTSTSSYSTSRPTCAGPMRLPRPRPLTLIQIGTDAGQTRDRRGTDAGQTSRCSSGRACMMTARLLLLLLLLLLFGTHLGQPCSAVSDPCWRDDEVFVKFLK